MTRATDYTDENGLGVRVFCVNPWPSPQGVPQLLRTELLSDSDHDHALLTGRGDHLFAFCFRVQRREGGRSTCHLRLSKEVAIVVTFEHEFRVIRRTAV